MTTQPSTARAVAAVVSVALVLSGCSSDDDGSPDVEAEGEEQEGLERFADRSIEWGACADPEQAQYDVECATVEVPMDYEQPDGERLTVGLARRPAGDPDQRLGVLFTNPGGPGSEGLSMASVLAEQPAGEVYDTIGMDPRGVGGSTQLYCDEFEEPDRTDRPDSRQELAPYTEAAQAEEQACAAGGGDLRRHITSMNTARDMDLIRRMLGEDRISFLGYFYGTFLGPLYGEMFPDHLDRSVLDSATDPSATWREQEAAGVAATEENVAAWQEWVAARDVTFGLGEQPAATEAVLDRFAAYLAGQPLGDILDVATFDVAIGSGTRYRSMWANLAWELGDLLPALDGAPVDAESARQLAVLASPGGEGGGSVAQDQEEPPVTDGGEESDERPNGTYQAILCDWEWPRDPDDYYPGMAEVADEVPYGDSVSRVAPSNCTFTSDRDPMVEIGEREYPEGIVVAATGDTQTAYVGGLSLADHLNMPLITVQNSGIHGHYGEGDACVDDAVNAYLVEGTLPDRRTECETTRDVVADIPTDIPTDRGFSPPADGLVGLFNALGLDRRTEIRSGPRAGYEASTATQKDLTSCQTR